MQRLSEIGYPFRLLRGVKLDPAVWVGHFYIYFFARSFVRTTNVSLVPLKTSFLMKCISRNCGKWSTTGVCSGETLKAVFSSPWRLCLRVQWLVSNHNHVTHIGALCSCTVFVPFTWTVALLLLCASNPLRTPSIRTSKYIVSVINLEMEKKNLDDTTKSPSNSLWYCDYLFNSLKSVRLDASTGRHGLRLMLVAPNPFSTSAFWLLLSSGVTLSALMAAESKFGHWR